MPENTSNNLVGTAGEYYVCAEICRQGFLALLTPKNNPLFDVVVTNASGTKSASIQVKTRSIHNKQGWKLSADFSDQGNANNIFVVLVNLKENELPDFYVYEYSVLANRVSRVYQEYLAQPKKDGTPRKEVKFRWFDERSFTEDDRKRKNNWQLIVKAMKSV